MVGAGGRGGLVPFTADSAAQRQPGRSSTEVFVRVCVCARPSSVLKILVFTTAGRLLGVPEVAEGWC